VLNDEVFVIATKESGILTGNYFYNSRDEAQAAIDDLPEDRSRYLQPYGFAAKEAK
jgi:hypothetical protein